LFYHSCICLYNFLIPSCDLISALYPYPIQYYNPLHKWKPHLCCFGYFLIDQWSSTWGARTPGGTRRHIRGYVKLRKDIIS
jgi:hypothetical protein